MKQIKLVRNTLGEYGLVTTYWYRPATQYQLDDNSYWGSKDLALRSRDRILGRLAWAEKQKEIDQQRNRWEVVE